MGLIGLICLGIIAGKYLIVAGFRGDPDIGNDLILLFFTFNHSYY